MADKIDAIFIKVSGWSILAEILSDEASSRMPETIVAQPANFLIQACTTDWLERHGVSPAAVVGHSVGEVTAAWVSGVLTLEEAVYVSHHRSRLQQLCAGLGSMLAVGITENEAKELIASISLSELSIAAINGPTSLTLAGDTRLLEKAAEQLEAQGKFNRFLKVELPYHSHQMDSIKPAIRESLACLKPKEPAIPIYSTVTGELVSGVAYDAEYWCDNVREPVLFSKAINTLASEDHKFFVEIGPHPVLRSSINECLKERKVDAKIVSTLRRLQDDAEAMLLTLGDLYSAGHKVNWLTSFNPNANYVSLPSYPWQRTKYWYETQETLNDKLGAESSALLGTSLNDIDTSWEISVNRYHIPYLEEHYVQSALVLPGASYVELGLEVSRALQQGNSASLTELKFERELTAA